MYNRKKKIAVNATQKDTNYRNQTRKETNTYQNE